MVLLGITFFFALYRFDEVRAKISMVMGVFMPFITGFAIAYLLNSPMCFFERTLYRNLRYRRGLSIVTVYLLGVAILSILLNLIIPQVVQSITDLMVNMQTYLEQLNTLVQSLIARFHLEGEGITDLVISYQELMNKITRLASDAMPKILNFGVAVGSGVVTAITALISSIYMLAGKGRLVPQLKKLIYAIAPKTSAERFLSVCSRANGVFVGFINGKLIDSAIIGALLHPDDDFSYPLSSSGQRGCGRHQHHPVLWSHHRGGALCYDSAHRGPVGRSALRHPGHCTAAV